jgi:hypothetical protein
LEIDRVHGNAPEVRLRVSGAVLFENLTNAEDDPDQALSLAATPAAQGLPMPRIRSRSPLPRLSVLEWNEHTAN